MRPGDGKSGKRSEQRVVLRDLSAPMQTAKGPPRQKARKAFFYLAQVQRNRFLLADAQLVVLHGEVGGVALLQGAVQHLLGHGVLHLALDGTDAGDVRHTWDRSPPWPAPPQPRRWHPDGCPWPPSARTTVFSIRRATSLDVLLAQGTEDDDVVNPVEELRPEGLAQLRHDGLLAPAGTASPHPDRCPAPRRRSPACRRRR